MVQGETPGELVPEAPEARQPAPQPERPEITYRLTTRDVQKSYFQALAQHPRRKRVVLLYFTLMPAFLGVLFGLAFSPLFGIGLAVVMWLALIFYLPWELARKTMRQHGARGTQRIGLSPENVAGWSEGIGEFKYDWGFVEKVTDAKDYVAFHWKTGRTGIVPKRAFPDAGSAARFAQAAQTWHAASLRSGAATGSEITPTHPAVVDASQELDAPTDAAGASE
jgi:hypothetical protein